MSLKPLEKKVRRFLASITEVQLVFINTLNMDSALVLLARDRDYGVCTINPTIGLISAKNYNDANDALLSARMTACGLIDLIQWSNREIATRRFRAESGTPAVAPGIHHLPP
jgi:hypothetical protein